MYDCSVWLDYLIFFLYDIEIVYDCRADLGNFIFYTM